MTFHSEEREKLLKISDITEWLNVSHSTIYDWIKKNDFPKPMVLGFSKPGSRKSQNASRWHEEEVRDWLRNRPRGGANR